MSKDNGGPAFVFPGFEFFDTRANDGEGERVVYEPYKGMTLRDYFAAKFLCGRAAVPGSVNPEMDAEFAYRVADAMLAERSK